MAELQPGDAAMTHRNASNDTKALTALVTGGAAGIGQAWFALLWDFRVYELSIVSLDLHRAQSGARFDYLTAGECLLSLRPAAVDAAPQRRGDAHAAENRRHGTGDSRRFSDLLGKIMNPHATSA